MERSDLVTWYPGLAVNKNICLLIRVRQAGDDTVGHQATLYVPRPRVLAVNKLICLPQSYRYWLVHQYIPVRRSWQTGQSGNNFYSRLNVFQPPAARVGRLAVKQLMCPLQYLVGYVGRNGSGATIHYWAYRYLVRYTGTWYLVPVPNGNSTFLVPVTYGRPGQTLWWTQIG